MKLKEFSLECYSSLLRKFIEKEYQILSFNDYLESNKNQQKILVLRHDVDKKPLNSLNKAKIEKDFGISATYYFRIVKESFDEDTIKKIAELGHEIGFHYEDLTLTKGNLENAIQLFLDNLNLFRTLYPVTTICMHGSPMSKWNNMDIWKKYNYRDYGIIGEPNFDLNFNEFFYLTDTGMLWNLSKYAVRDVAKGKFDIKIKYSSDILNHLEHNMLPDKVMINTHPQRWSDNITELIWEKSTQVVKNQIKRLIKKKYNAYNYAD